MVEQLSKRRTAPIVPGFARFGPHIDYDAAAATGNGDKAVIGAAGRDAAVRDAATSDTVDARHDGGIFVRSVRRAASGEFIAYIY